MQLSISSKLERVSQHITTILINNLSVATYSIIFQIDQSKNYPNK